MSINKGSIQLAGSIVTLANAVAITDAVAHSYALVAQGGLTVAQIMKHKEMSIFIYDTHDKTGEVRLRPNNPAFGGFAPANDIYVATIITTGSDYLSFVGNDKGTGGNASVITVAALGNRYDNLQVVVTYTAPPTTGQLTIKVILR